MRTLLEVLRRIESFVIGAIMVAMSALYTFNVLVREIVPSRASSVAWIEEACLYGMAWVIFLGLGLALERGRHIAMTSLLERLAPGLRRGLKLAIDLIGLAFSLYIAKLAVDITIMVVKSGQVSPTLDISAAWLYAAMPVGFVLLALRYALELPQAEGRLKPHATAMEH